MFKFSSLFVLLIRLSELLLLPDLAILPCENLSKTLDNFSSLNLCRNISDGFTFESSELDDVFSLLLISVDDVADDEIVVDIVDNTVVDCVLIADGDGGVSDIGTGESINGPTRRAIFGGGLNGIITKKEDKKPKFRNQFYY